MQGLGFINVQHFRRGGLFLQLSMGQWLCLSRWPRVPISHKASGNTNSGIDVLLLCTHSRSAVARPFLSPQTAGRILDARTQVHATSPQWLPRENHHACHSIGIWLVPAESLPPLMTLSSRNFYTREKHGYNNVFWSQKSSCYTWRFSLYSWLLAWDILKCCRGAPVDPH